MCKAKQDDLKSKIAALDAVKALSKRNDVVTSGDVLEIIKSYREVLSVQVNKCPECGSSMTETNSTTSTWLQCDKCEYQTSKPKGGDYNG